MQVNRLTELEQCERLCPVWDCLAHGNVFRRGAWSHSWWRHYGDTGKLYVLQVTNGQGQTVGLAPWYLESTVRCGRIIRPLGSNEVHSDHLGILATPEYAEDVAQALASWMSVAASGGLLEDRWHLLQLCSTDRQDRLVKRFVDHLQRSGHSVHQRAACRCWKLDLPTDWDAYLRRLSKGRRKQVRRLVRDHLDSGRTAVRTAQTTAQLEQAYATLVDLHQRRWQIARQAGCFSSRRFADFLHDATRRMLHEGMARLYWLEHEGRAIAAELCLIGGDTVYAYQSGIDPHGPARSPGTILEAAIIRDAIRLGCRVFDFLRGDEPYKTFWQAQPYPCVEYRVASRHPAGQLRHQAWLAHDTMKHWLKTGLQATGLM